MMPSFRYVACILILACSLSMHGQAGESSKATPIGSAHVYKTVNGRDLHVYTASPDPKMFPGARPVLISIHGGGFTGGTASSLNPQAAWFLRRGIASAEVEYRLLKSGADSLDDCIRDARSAVRWLRSHAAELNVDPDRIILTGGSAGGYLVEANILLDGPDEPTDDKSVSTMPVAAVVFNPVLSGATGAAMAKLMGDRWKELSPLDRVTAKQPPTIFLHGASDTTVGTTDIVEFQHRLKAAGVRTELDFYPGQTHGFFNREPYTTATLLAADAFLTSLHLTAGPAPSEPNPLPADKLPTVTR